VQIADQPVLSDRKVIREAGLGIVVHARMSVTPQSRLTSRTRRVERKKQGDADANLARSTMRKSIYEPSVLAWRAEQLLRVGVDSAPAAVLAQDPSVDLHVLLELLDRGCPTHLAVRILAPLDHDLSCDPLQER